MLAAIERAFSLVFPVFWIGGTLALFFWARATTNSYLQRFPPVEGVPLNMYTYIPGESPHIRQAGRDAMFNVQQDPEREALRRTMWKRYLYSLVWGLGFPILIGGIAAIITIANHPQ